MAVARALPLTCCSCRSLLAMPHGSAGGDKAAAEQALLDEAMERFPALFSPGWIWLMDRNYRGTPRIARLIKRTHVLIRLKSDIPLKRTSEILPDGSYRAELAALRIPMARGCSGTGHADGDVGPGGFVGGGTVPMSDPGCQ